MISLGSGQRREIRNGGDTGSFSSLVWSPDGKRITFQRVEYVPPANRGSDPKGFFAAQHYQYSYESVDVDSGQTVASAKDFVMASACGLRDGRVLFLRNTLEQVFIYHLWTVRTDPNTGKFLDAPRQVTHDDYNLKEISVSADGQDTVAVRVLNEHPNVYVADLPPASQYPRFTRVRRLTFTDADEYPHAWTPDGQSVIFEKYYRYGSFDLFRQDIDQSAAQPLAVSNDSKVLAHVSPDGKWILYNQEFAKKQWKVMRIPLSGGPAETLLSESVVPGEYNCRTLRDVASFGPSRTTNSCFSGAGRRAGQRARVGADPLEPGDHRRLGHFSGRISGRDSRPRSTRRTNPAGAARRAGRDDGKDRDRCKGLKNLSGVTWAADGRGWYVSVSSPIGGVLFYVDLEGRILTKLMESMVSIFAVPSPDGRHVAYVDWAASANVWQVRGLCGGYCRSPGDRHGSV